MTKYNHVNEEPDLEEGIEAYPSSGEGGDEPFHDEEEQQNNNRRALSMIKETTLIEYAVGGLAFASVSTAIAAMIVTSSFVVNGAGLCAMLLGPYSYWQQRNIMDVKTLKETHETLVKEVDLLKSENERLKGLVDDLGHTVSRYEEMENTFDYLSDMNIESVEEFRQQVQEGKSILGMMRKNVKASTLQNVITVVLNSDMDRNFVFDKEEVEKLIENLKGINGLEMNEERFRKLITSNKGCVHAVVEILNDIIHSDAREGNEIFTLSGRLD